MVVGGSEGASDPSIAVSTAISSASQPTSQSTPTKSLSYNEQLKKEYNAIFDVLEITELQKKYLQSRWLDQILWMEGRAGRSQTWYKRLRLTTIIGGVIIPILISLTPPNNPRIAGAIRYTTISLGAIVAVSSAVEEFFNYGERWRHYRRSAESLKIQGWQFFQLSGLYADYVAEGHRQAFNLFATQVEEIIQKDVEAYSTQVAQAPHQKADSQSQSPTKSTPQSAEESAPEAG
ncbi:MAG: DUF4231 domain-containing protein [Scytolyngbya sp. HA4215-MV1]|jgi:hypothetical protein|nr:DUF4231 domain-containing protein [Scytolyngbya sp. HA4215-MV1]